jgi:hypothetical protein
LNIDNILSKVSTKVFSNLEIGQRRIIRILALKSPLNMREIGKYTSKYTIGFDRWGVKKRLEGTRNFIGLIPADYIIKISANEKESKYGLTIKGLFASLCNTIFEKNYLVKEYESFLATTGMKDSKLANWGIQLVKYEIALILYYAKAQGLDWTRFKQLRLYIHELKQNSRELLRPFYMNMELLNYNDEQNEFEEIKEQYFRLISTVHMITEISGKDILYPFDRIENYNDLDEDGRSKMDSLKNIRDWYYNMYFTHLKIPPIFDLDLLDKLEYISERGSEEPDAQYYSQLPKIKEISKMLRNHGYKIKDRFRDFS